MLSCSRFCLRFFSVAMWPLFLAAAIAGSIVVGAEPASTPVAPRADAKRTRPLDPNAPSLVILPPKILGEASQHIRTLAELACDRLAQEMDLGGVARVVDRTQLENVLKERELAAEGGARQLLSYDAMVRLEVDIERLPPRSRLLVIDLSTGNLLKEKAFGWPVGEADMTAMVEQCRAALKGLAKADREKRLKVRLAGLVGLEDATIAPRMRPLAERLGESFQKTLAASDRLLLVQHLEAGSAKEESLLVAMGLSRLPGQRRFAPQADATIELRASEHDALGKSFEETPVEIGVRLRQGEKYEGGWVVTTGTVKDFDVAISQAWDKLAKSLDKVAPGAAAKVLDDMVLRRKQAEAELRAALVVESHDATEQSPRGQQERLALEQLAHVEAALKIDPTFEQAAYRQALILGRLTKTRGNTPAGVESARQLVTETVRYLERFRDSEKWRNRDDVAIYAVAALPFLGPLGSNRSAGSVGITTEQQEMLDGFKHIVELTVLDDIHILDQTTSLYSATVYRGMGILSTPLPRRRQWLTGILRQFEERVKKTDKDPSRDHKAIHESYQNFCISAAEALREDGQLDLAKQLLARLLDDWLRVKPSPGAYQIEVVRKNLSAIKDPSLLAEFDRQLKSDTPPSQKPERSWPEIKLFGDEQPPEAPVVIVKYSSSGLPRLRPLAEGEGQFYLLAGPKQNLVVRLPLDAQGRPVGKLILSKTGNQTWDTLKALAAPHFDNVECAQYCHGKLYLGTSNSGLLAYDPKTDQWKVYGPEQGLPSRRVNTAIPIGDNLLFCSCGHHGMDAAHYTFDIGSGEVKLVRQGEAGKYMSLEDRFTAAWRDGPRLMGFSETGLWEDLLGGHPKFTKFPSQTPFSGWNYCINFDFASHIHYCGTIDSRYFVSWHHGMTEYDSAGKPMRTWRTAYTAGEGAIPGWQRFAVPVDTPIPEVEAVGISGRLLIFFEHLGRKVLGYDLEADAWYGPLEQPDSTLRMIVGTPRGVWSEANGWGAFYFPADDLIATAKKSGRVLTTKQFLERRRQCIESAPPLDRIKFAVMLHQFKTASKGLEEFLKMNPNHVEALELIDFIQKSSTASTEGK